MGEGLSDYAERVSRAFMETHPVSMRKQKAQYFTPKNVARFMASLVLPTSGELRVLDPGAGTGCLTAALCERLLHLGRTLNIIVDAYELDEEIVPGLQAVLSECVHDFDKNGHRLESNIIQEDFILHKSSSPFRTGSADRTGSQARYDIVIANPPYFKLPKDSPQSLAMPELVSGQPNIYFLFMGLSARFLLPNGQMVFIIPRSFCSGSYYRKFRKWFLGQCIVQDIHIFESRRDIFEGDGILQENIILNAIRSNVRPRRVRITSCKDGTMEDISEIAVGYQDVIHDVRGESFIRIPTSTTDVEALHTVDSWKNNLRNLNLEVSTGPVVPFRAKRHLLEGPQAGASPVPLLWMHNLVDMRVVWPSDKNGKPKAIMDNKETGHLLVPAKNYVLLKRFSSKEQKRRLYASVLKTTDFQYDKVGLENHLNYIHRPGGSLTLSEAFGLAAILNASLLDAYFRTLSGNTQVNATEIRRLPLPDSKIIIEIGRNVQDGLTRAGKINVNGVVTSALESEIRATTRSFGGAEIDKD